MILIIDNYDSFTYNLVDYFQQIGCDIVVKKNDTPMDEINQLNMKALVISPGPGTPNKSGITNEVIKNYYQKLPILGICLGFQAIGEHFGAKLAHLETPKHGKISTIKLAECELYQNLPPEINVTRYHSLILEEIPRDLKVTSISQDDHQIMSFKHISLPVWGIQYHPEAVLSEYGLNILRNWVTFNKLA